MWHGAWLKSGENQLNRERIYKKQILILLYLMNLRIFRKKFHLKYRQSSCNPLFLRQVHLKIPQSLTKRKRIPMICLRRSIFEGARVAGKGSKALS